MYSKCSLAQVAHLILSPTLESAMFDVLLNISGAYIHTRRERKRQRVTQKRQQTETKSHAERQQKEADIQRETD